MNPQNKRIWHAVKFAIDDVKEQERDAIILFESFPLANVLPMVEIYNRLYGTKMEIITNSKYTTVSVGNGLWLFLTNDALFFSGMRTTFGLALQLFF